MSTLHRPLLKTLGFALCTVFVGLPALADDTEIYKSNASAGAKPNVLMILDTSGSMDGTVITTAPPYDPNTVYAGTCDASRIYFGTSDTPPTCATDNWFPASSNNCDASAADLVNIGGGGMWPALGNPRERAAQYRSNQWRGIKSGNSGAVDCQDDNGVHGKNGTVTNKYVKNNGPWGNTSTLSWSSIGNNYRFYTANYLNYKNGVGVTTMTRLEIVRNVAINLTNSLQNVNLGLMRYNTDAEGGYVLNAVEDIATNRANILATLNAFTPTTGSGGTPLSETYYEAAQYLTGGKVVYGDRSMPGVSDDRARTAPGSGSYQSPLQYQCQKNYVVYLTDGAPTRDDGAIADIGTMIGGACKADPIEPFHDGGWVTGSGMCMDDLAGWLNTSDLSTTLAGRQTASTYMVGFGNDLDQTPGDTLGYLDEIAKAGGTEHSYKAGDVPTLTAALQAIFSGIQEKSSTFITPSISVNTFNRAQTNTDLYFSLFKVAQGEHWPGNLKKYRLDATKIKDANDVDAVDTSGFFAPGTLSYWSPAPDGNNVDKGGAASRLPDPSARKLYTRVAATAQLSDVANALSVTNPAMNDALVGAGSSTTSCTAECQAAINWARGFDVNDQNGDGSTTDAVRFMGDPLHGKPAVVGYGGTTALPDADDTVVYFPTNDGFLHAINGRTSGTGAGQELWAFIPPVLLPRLHELYVNNAVSQRSYGLDGDVQVLKFDKNQDGIVDASAGDKVWLFFGMRGGGDRYFGLDVTDRNDPRLLWSIGSGELPGIGWSWSPPVITRVSVGTGGSANTSAERFVLVFGGGYDMNQETQPYQPDAIGNRIFFVDAESGNLLWFGGGAGIGTPDRSWAKMTNSIPGKITVIDTDGDKFADRMYAADMGGRVWRFDITNGQPAASLVAGGVIAQLGAGSNGALPNSEARRFYNAPDVALVQRRAEDPYYNIAIGSGYRGHPLDTVTQDRFYAIRDKSPYARLSQVAYNAITPVVDGDLVDITANPAGSTVSPGQPGWKFILPNQPGRSGEKVLAEATTVNNVLLFTTFQPLPASGTDPCYPANINRAYAMFADSGKPALDFNDDGVLDNNDISVDLNQAGIVGEISVALIRQANPDPATPPGSPPTVCVAGVEVLKKCVSAGGTIRTFWQRDDAN